MRFIFVVYMLLLFSKLYIYDIVYEGSHICCKICYSIYIQLFNIGVHYTANVNNVAYRIFLQRKTVTKSWYEVLKLFWIPVFVVYYYSFAFSMVKRFQMTWRELKNLYFSALEIHRIRLMFCMFFILFLYQSSQF